MSWLTYLRRLSRKTIDRSRPRTCRSSYPRLEELESRLVPYSATGNLWPHPELITISFMPDGANLGGSVTSNLFSSFNSRFGSTSTWEGQILKAAQTWAEYANINFAVVPDNGAPSGSGNYQQGDPGYGDIRVGGFNFGNSTLGIAYYPPSGNNYSIAGDIAFNTGQPFNVGSTYDLYTVALHEIGHALGLDESSTLAADMYANYTGVKSGLNSDDISGIRNIYGGNYGRSWDSYDAAGSGKNFSNAANLNSTVSASNQTTLVQNLNLDSPGTAEYFTVNAPQGTTGTFTVNVQSSGLSLLAPTLTVYAADQQTVLGSASGLGQYGTRLAVTVRNVTAGQQFYVKVQGADSSPFGMGKYTLTLNFASNASPVVPVPITQTANGNPLSGGGGLAQGQGVCDVYLDSVPQITGVSPDTGAPGYTRAQNLVLNGSGPPLEFIKLYRDGVYIGQTFSLLATWTFNYTGTTLPQGSYRFTATATDLFGNTSKVSFPFGVVVDTTAPAQPVIAGASPGNAPVLSGTAQNNTNVQVYANGLLLGSTAADSNGNWSFSSPTLAPGSYRFTATATDLAGNTSTASRPYTLVVNAPGATSGPQVSLAASSNGGGNGLGGFDATSNTPTFTGTAAPLSVVTILDGNTVLGITLANLFGNWTFSSPALTSGQHDIAVETTDLLALVSTLSAPLDVTV